jgi:hypothetical protein
MTAMISLHTEHGCGVLLTARPRHRWKDRLTSVCIPTQQLAVAMFRSSWNVAARPRTALAVPPRGDLYADYQD